MLLRQAPQFPLNLDQMLSYPIVLLLKLVHHLHSRFDLTERALDLAPRMLLHLEESASCGQQSSDTRSESPPAREVDFGYPHCASRSVIDGLMVGEEKVEGKGELRLKVDFVTMRLSFLLQLLVAIRDGFSAF